MLKVGTYHSPDGVVHVSPERLVHWQRQFQRLTQARQVVPMHWDHGSDLASLQPVSMDAFTRRERSARNSVGRLKDFRVIKGGRAAEVTFETLDPVATQRCETNAVYVSPVVMPKWRDGAGNEYDDCITHLDLVDHPVDHSQGPARRIDSAPKTIACALRMGLSQPYRMGAATVADEDEILDDETPADDSPGDDSPPPAAEPEAAPPAEPEGDDSPGVDVGELMLALADHGVILPEDTNEANFLDRLRVALIAKKGALPGAGQQPGGNQFGNDMGDTIIADPQIATMSLAHRNALKFAEQTHRKGIETRLARLTETGRCTPAERDAQLQKLKTVRLSLTKDGQPADNKVTDWIASRAALPKGAVWEPRERLRRMSAKAIPQPEPKTFATDPKSAAAMSEKDIDSTAKLLL